MTVGTQNKVERFDATDKHKSGLSHPFLEMGPGPMELGKLAHFD